MDDAGNPTLSLEAARGAARGWLRALVALSIAWPVFLFTESGVQAATTEAIRLRNIVQSVGFIGFVPIALVALGLPSWQKRGATWVLGGFAMGVGYSYAVERWMRAHPLPFVSPHFDDFGETLGVWGGVGLPLLVITFALANVAVVRLQSQRLRVVWSGQRFAASTAFIWSLMLVIMCALRQSGLLVMTPILFWIISLFGLFRAIAEEQRGKALIETLLRGDPSRYAFAPLPEGIAEDTTVAIVDLDGRSGTQAIVQRDDERGPAGYREPAGPRVVAVAR